MSGRRKGASVQMHKPDSQTLLGDRRGEGESNRQAGGRHGSGIRGVMLWIIFVFELLLQLQPQIARDVSPSP